MDKKQQIIARSAKEYSDVSKDPERRYNFGGSEIASLRGKNKHQTWLDQIISKLNLIPRESGLVMVWGSIMEHVIRNVMEHIWKCEIDECGAVQIFDNLRYTMDGMGEVDFVEGGKKFVLFEFKTTMGRRFNYGEIPEYYFDQPSTGLNGIEEFDEARYIENKLVMCQINELDFSSNYTNKLSFKRWCDNRYEAYAFGVMSIFTNEIIEDDYIELCDCEDNEVFEVFEKIKADKYKILLHEPAINHQRFTQYRTDVESEECDYKSFINMEYVENEAEEFAYRNNMKHSYIVPWKILNINIVKLEKDPNYIQELKVDLEDKIELLKTLLSMESKNDQIEHILNIKVGDKDTKSQKILREKNEFLQRGV